jgi:glucan phosphoethanolaminetransferase (alkaline phosphatase superfamily)
MKIVLILLASVIVIFLEKTNISNHWNKRETIVFFVYLFFGILLSVAWVLQVDLINPLDILAEVYRPISEPITSYLNQFK